MRVLKALLVAAVVLGSLSFGRPAAASTADLVQQLDELAAAFPGGVGLWIADPTSSRPLYTREADEPVIAASLYKLGVLAEAERRVETGELRYSDIITIQPEDVVEYSYEEAGTEMTLDEALEAMITISDNGSALALWRLLGGANIDATLVREGMPDFHVALDENEDNVVTPRAVGTFFTLLAKKELISIAASERMLARLERQQIVDRLPSSLPEGVVVAHKTGNLVGAVHDAGLIFTPSGPRVVVAMTWDAYDEDANAFISNVGALVYGAVLEPPVNARFGVPRNAVEGDTGSRVRVTVSVTNTGTNSWAASGPDSVALYWQLLDDANAVVTSAPAASRLPPLAPGRSTNVGLQVATPATPGLWHVTVSLTDGTGRMLASLGAATATFDIKTHAPYLVKAGVAVPTTLHRGEASLLVTTYTALATAKDEHPLAISWRAIDPTSARIAAEGSSSVGVLAPGATGTFYSPFVAPRLLGTYKLSYELREGDVAVSETVTTTVTILRRRTYPDDDGGRTLAPITITPSPVPAPTRSAFPRPSTSLVPKVNLPSLPTPKGKPTSR